MKPLPRDIGIVLCTIERNASGLNMFWPKFICKLADNTYHDKNFTSMLESKKVKGSKTPHYQINVQTGIQKLMNKPN